MSRITEIGSDIFQISTFIPEVGIYFNQFLVRDDRPLLYHTGMKSLFAAVQAAVARLIDPQKIGWIGFSHFEADECGALREWQSAAPQAVAVCSTVSKMVSVDDVVALRPARALLDGEVLETGKYRFRFLQTPHVPHAWDAAHLFEETGATLLCSDLFHQNGKVEPKTDSDVVGRFRETLIEYQKGPLADYFPYTSRTRMHLGRLAELQPKMIATMHGTAFEGDGRQAIYDLEGVLREVMG